MCEKTIEDRLLRYIERKKYYLKNKIIPDITPETEFMIDDIDLKDIRTYLNGKDKMEHIQSTIMYKNQLHYNKPIGNKKSDTIIHAPQDKKIMNYLRTYENPPIFLSRTIGQATSNRTYTNDHVRSCNNNIREEYYKGNKMVTEDFQRGMPMKTKKTYGYDDVFEHNFDYIDSDIQDDKHVVLPFPVGGISTRLENKKQRKRII